MAQQLNASTPSRQPVNNARKTATFNMKDNGESNSSSFIVQDVDQQTIQVRSYEEKPDTLFSQRSPSVTNIQAASSDN